MMKSERMTYFYGKRKWAGLVSRLSFALLVFHFSCLATYAQDTERRYDAFFLEAVCEQEKGHADAAFDLFRHCLEIDSTRSEAYFYLAKYYMLLKKRDVALNYLQKAVDAEPDNTTYIETLANACIKVRDYKKGVVMLERLYALQHDRDELLGYLTQLYEQNEDYDNAIRTLTRLETLEGKSERLSYAKSDLYTRKGDKKAAIREMKMLADQYPNDNNFRCFYANTLYQNGQQKKAQALYDKILKEEPDNRLAQMSLLSNYNHQHDSVGAARMMNMLLDNHNATTEDRVQIMKQMVAESETSGGDSTRVLQKFRYIMDGPYADGDIGMLCAAYMTMKKMPGDSIAPVLERVLQLTPDNASARLQLVGYAWQAQNRDRVIALCREARQYNPDEMAFYYYQGIASYQKGDLDDALNAFQNGISVINQESDPAIVSDFYAVMGDILHQKGMDQEAYAAYDSCLQWKDDNYGCLNNYAYYLSVNGEQLNRAEQMSYRTIKAEPKNATYLDTYAWILFMQQRYSEAKIYIDQTLACDSDTSAVLLEHAGDIYYHVGDVERAVDFWQQSYDRADMSEEGTGKRLLLLLRKIQSRKYLKE